MKKKHQTNKGVYIVVVVKDSPAFHSDILEGDILVSVNGTKMETQKQAYEYLTALREQKPDTVTLVLKRDKKLITKKVEFRN